MDAELVRRLSTATADLLADESGTRQVPAVQPPAVSVLAAAYV